MQSKFSRYIAGQESVYQGATSVSLKVFNSYKIFNFFNSLDMCAINTGFGFHK